MRKSFAALSLAALIVLAGVWAAPASAAGGHCNAILQGGSTLLHNPDPTSSHAVKGTAVGDQKVRIVARDAEPIYVQIEPRNPRKGILIVGGQLRVESRADSGWVTTGQLHTTKQLDKCLQRRF
jgi:hypothetical protein